MVVTRPDTGGVNKRRGLHSSTRPRSCLGVAVSGFTLAMATPGDTAGTSDPLATGTAVSECPVCDRSPRVLVAVRHPSMRRLTRELLDREHGCWTARELGPTEPLDMALKRVTPDLLVVDSSDFPACCRAQLGTFPPQRVVVVGPEPLAAYRRAALAGSAGAWLSREAIPDELSVAMRMILGCAHAPCPQARVPTNDGV